MFLSIGALVIYLYARASVLVRGLNNLETDRTDVNKSFRLNRLHYCSCVSVAHFVSVVLLNIPLFQCFAVHPFYCSS